MRNLSVKNRILLILVARYIASLLDESIPAEITLYELASMAGTSEKVASARISEISSYIEHTGRGKYKLRSLSFAEMIVNKLRGEGIE